MDRDVLGPALDVIASMVPRIDAQVVAQHIMVGSLVTTTIGRVLLDIESDTSTL